MKKLSLFLSVVMILSMFSVTVKADNQETPYECEASDEAVIEATDHVEDFLNSFLRDKALYISGMETNATYPADVLSAMSNEKNVMDTDLASHGSVITNISTIAKNIRIIQEDDSYIKLGFSEEYSVEFEDALGNSDASCGVKNYEAVIKISDGNLYLESISPVDYEDSAEVPESEIINNNAGDEEILSAASPSVEVAVLWAISTANDQTHGYSQANRWGNPDYDCSSFVISAFKAGGFDVPDYEWGNTATMRNTFEGLGFTWHSESEVKTVSQKYSKLKRGDILLRSGHTEIYIGEGKQVGAHSNSPSYYHPDRSPEPGDQGDEVSVCDWYNGGWEGILRFEGDTVNDIITTDNYGAGIYYINTTSYMNIRKGPGTNYEIVGRTGATGEIAVYETQDNWGRVNYNGTVGWMCLDYSIWRRMLVVTPLISFEAWFSPTKASGAASYEGEGITNGVINDTYYLNYYAYSPSGSNGNVNNTYDVKLSIYDPDGGWITGGKFSKRDIGDIAFYFRAPGIYKGEITVTGNNTEFTIQKDFVVTKSGSDTKYKNMYRLYNPYSGEHFYTSSGKEKNDLVKAGWQFEGTAWQAPEESGTPVYRLYNPNEGDHHYTVSKKEKNDLVKAGWKYEGIGWYSDENEGTALYRLYNPNASTGSHHYTISKKEKDKLVEAGWKYEGIAWYGR